MMKLKQILCTLIILGASVLNLSACGQMGPLYLPDAPMATSKPTPQPAVKP